MIGFMLKETGIKRTKMKKIEVKDRTEWRKWLAANHAKESEIWLIYRKKRIGKSSIEYEASVEEALCYGWIDSIIKKLDDLKHARKFTLRKKSAWSPSNKACVEQLIKDSLITENRLKKVNTAKKLGNWENLINKPRPTFDMPKEFEQELRKNKKAKKTFRV